MSEGAKNAHPSSIDFIRLGRLLALNIAASRRLAEANRKAVEEIDRRQELARRGVTNFGNDASVEIKQYSAYSIRSVARALEIDNDSLIEAIRHLEVYLGVDVVVMDRSGRRTGQLTERGWELAVIGLMLDRVRALIGNDKVPPSVRRRILHRMIYRLDQDIGIETSPSNIASAERNPELFDWVEELVPPTEASDDPTFDFDEYEREQEAERQRAEEERNNPFEPPLPERI